MYLKIAQIQKGRQIKMCDERCMYKKKSVMKITL